MSLEETMSLVEKQQNKAIVAPAIPFTVTQNSTIKANSLRNVGLILERDELLKGMFAYNSFSFTEEVVREIPRLHIEKGNIEDSYIASILRYIEDKYEVLFPEKLLHMAISNEARKNAYNPVKEYMLKAEKDWDGISRAANILPDYLGVSTSEVTTLQTKLFFCGAVAKVFDPEAKFDYVLDLVGGQGVGKTTFLKLISNGWYTDQFVDFKDKDSYMNMQKALIINDDEMTATNNSDFETLKKFISSEQLEYRPPYARTSVIRPKNFVIARTTNEFTYLKDKTGERRFLPNLASKKLQKKNPITDLTPEAVEQIWGEFVSMYKNGFDFILSDEENAALEENRESFMYIDETEAQIEECLSGWPGNFITSAQIAKELGEAALVKNRKLAQKIKYVMDNHRGWEPGAVKKDGKVKRGYRRNSCN